MLIKLSIKWLSRQKLSSQNLRNDFSEHQDFKFFWGTSPLNSPRGSSLQPSHDSSEIKKISLFYILQKVGKSVLVWQDTGLLNYKCGFPLAEEWKKRKTFFSHTAGSMGSSARGVFRSCGIPFPTHPPSLCFLGCRFSSSASVTVILVC